LSIGKIKEAEELQRQYEKIIATNMVSTTTNQLSTSSLFMFTRTLWPQTTHADVKELQKFLNRKGFTVSSVGPGSTGNETNYFGVKTQLALIRYQESKKVEILDRAGLTKGTGIFGPITMGVVNAE
jgi:peptidoglycan hydrolase-like protein with peptidoglycan-binding domain